MRTLERELTALRTLERHIELQLEALGNQEGDAFEIHQQKADAALLQLEELHPVRKREVDALCSLLDKDVQGIPVDAMVHVLAEYPECEEAAQELQVLHRRVALRTASVRERCDLILSTLCARASS